MIGPRGEPLEIQIRTWDMHRVADFGVAAHWQYKEQTRGMDDFERKLSWLRQQLFDWQTDSKDAGEFQSSVINDLFTDQVFVFTPRGDVIDLPAGSTPLDFAYRIHSDVGNHCVGGKVNGRIVPLSYRLNNSDIVEVITRTNSQPSMDWLSFVVTSHARNKIRGFFRKLHFSDSVAKGREMLEKELERLGLDAPALMKSDPIANVVKPSDRGGSFCGDRLRPCRGRSNSQQTAGYPARPGRNSRRNSQTQRRESAIGEFTWPGYAADQSS